MRSNTWVCFECRLSVRRPLGFAGSAPCPECGGTCVDIGYKIRIPSRRATRAWSQLRDDLRRAALTNLERSGRAKTRRKHELEKQTYEIERRISELETKPRNSGRSGLIRQLRRRLAAVRLLLERGVSTP
jgi:hypothetical protein